MINSLLFPDPWDDPEQPDLPRPFPNPDDDDDE